ncbi:MAG: hypothetical protein M1834_006102 [Cirrosporium novae-zelandiae]|nr:MAG: hypothetical protein M1834_006102 [Cirrosporium novae-zelandiae]
MFLSYQTQILYVIGLSALAATIVTSLLGYFQDIMQTDEDLDNCVTYVAETELEDVEPRDPSLTAKRLDASILPIFSYISRPTEETSSRLPFRFGKAEIPKGGYSRKPGQFTQRRVPESDKLVSLSSSKVEICRVGEVAGSSVERESPTSEVGQPKSHLPIDQLSGSPPLLRRKIGDPSPEDPQEITAQHQDGKYVVVLEDSLQPTEKQAPPESPPKSISPNELGFTPNVNEQHHSAGSAEVQALAEIYEDEADQVPSQNTQRQDQGREKFTPSRINYDLTEPETGVSVEAPPEQFLPSEHSFQEDGARSPNFLQERQYFTPPRNSPINQPTTWKVSKGPQPSKRYRNTGSNVLTAEQPKLPSTEDLIDLLIVRQQSIRRNHQRALAERKALEAKIAHLAKENGVLLRQLQEASETSIAQQDSLKQYREKTEVFRSKIENMKKFLRGIGKDRDTLQNQATEFHQSSQLILALKEEIRGLKNDLIRLDDSLKAQKSDLQQDRTLKAKFDLMSVNLAEKSSLLATEQTRVKKLEALFLRADERNRHWVDLLNSHQSTLRLELSRIHDTIRRSSTDDFVDKFGDLVRIQEKLESCITQITTTNKPVRIASDDMNRLENAAKDIFQGLRSIFKCSHDARNENSEAAKHIEDQFISQFSALKSFFESVQNQSDVISELCTERACLSENLENTKSSLAEVRVQHQKSEVNEKQLKDRLMDMSCFAQLLNHQQKSAEPEYSERLREAEKINVALKEDLGSLRTVASQKTKSLETKDEEILQLRVAVDAVTQDLKDARDSISCLDSEKATLLKDCDKRYEDLRKEFSNTATKKAREQDSRLHNAHTQLKAVQASFKDTQFSLEDAQCQLERAKEVAKTLQKKLSTQESEHSQGISAANEKSNEFIRIFRDAFRGLLNDCDNTEVDGFSEVQVRSQADNLRHAFRLSQEEKTEAVKVVSSLQAYIKATEGIKAELTTVLNKHRLLEEGQHIDSLSVQSINQKLLDNEEASRKMEEELAKAHAKTQKTVNERQKIEKLFHVAELLRPDEEISMELMPTLEQRVVAMHEASQMSQKGESQAGTSFDDHLERRLSLTLFEDLTDTIAYQDETQRSQYIKSTQSTELRATPFGLSPRSKRPSTGKTHNGGAPISEDAVSIPGLAIFTDVRNSDYFSFSSSDLSDPIDYTESPGDKIPAERKIVTLKINPNKMKNNTPTNITMSGKQNPLNNVQQPNPKSTQPAAYHPLTQGSPVQVAISNQGAIRQSNYDTISMRQRSVSNAAGSRSGTPCSNLGANVSNSTIRSNRHSKTPNDVLRAEHGTNIKRKFVEVDSPSIIRSQTKRKRQAESNSQDTIIPDSQSTDGGSAKSQGLPLRSGARKTLANTKQPTRTRQASKRGTGNTTRRKPLTDQMDDRFEQELHG